MGFPVTQYYRISQITVKAADHATVLRTYTATPTYSPNNPTTRQITALTECTGSTCFAPTTFQWNNDISGSGQAVTSGSSSVSFKNVDPGNVRFGDINGGRSFGYRLALSRSQWKFPCGTVDNYIVRHWVG